VALTITVGPEPQRGHTMSEDYLEVSDATNLNLSIIKPGKPLGIEHDLEPNPEEETKKQVLSHYHGYINIFSEEKAKQLPLHWE